MPEEKKTQFGITKENLAALEFSSTVLQNNLKVQDKEVFESLRERFYKDLMFNMIFLLFNEFCQSHSVDESKIEVKGNNPVATIFFETWLKKVEENTQKEISVVNERVSDPRTKFLQAINSYKLTSTEDMQVIYSKALSDIKTLFYNNIVD